MILTHHGINSLRWDPQEYDPEDIPSGNSMQSVPMDRGKYAFSVSEVKPIESVFVDGGSSAFPLSGVKLLGSVYTDTGKYSFTLSNVEVTLV